MGEPKGQAERIEKLEEEVERLGQRYRGLGGQVGCLHRWMYDTIANADCWDSTVVFACCKCDARQVRKWGELAAEEIAALKVLGIRQKTKKDFLVDPLTVGDIGTIVAAVKKEMV